ncbi:MAG: coenzyme F420-0:L-glutamate ligase [Candidatus Promineifilaceae bacterium]|nr:coenzyme F420-0:L-glutamate ligase [Candidatus Promineifilaceae bacterium]
MTSEGQQRSETADRESDRPVRLELLTIPGLPEIEPGADLAVVMMNSLNAAGLALTDGDIIAVAHKIVSKAEGRLVFLDDVTPGQEAMALARETDKDPRLVELILQESKAVSRVGHGVLITRHRLGFTSANSGIDRSNVPQSKTGESVLLLPEDPDRSAAALRQALEQTSGARLGVVIVDSHGRPFRLGTVGVAIGVAGLPALWDRRGERDRYGYTLQHTEVGTADEIAAAASLLMGQADESTPVVLLRGLRLPEGDGRAADLVRPKELDLYR